MVRTQRGGQISGCRRGGQEQLVGLIRAVYNGQHSPAWEQQEEVLQQYA